MKIYQNGQINCSAIGVQILIKAQQTNPISPNGSSDPVLNHVIGSTSYKILDSIVRTLFT